MANDRTLKLWLEATPAPPDSPAFPSARGATLSRDGVNYVLQDALREAAKTCPSLKTKRVSPHVLRHTTAMHLLQAGDDITRDRIHHRDRIMAGPRESGDNTDLR